MILRNRLKERRAALDVNQQEMGRLCGVSRQTISLIERGDYSPSVTLALTIAKVCGVTVEEVFYLQEEELMEQKKDHTQKDIEFHTAIAMGSKNLVIPRLIPIINSSIPLFVETTGNILKTETIETHREIAEAIAEHNAVRAQDAMYMHLMYNKRRINSSK